MSNSDPQPSSGPAFQPGQMPGFAAPTGDPWAAPAPAPGGPWTNAPAAPAPAFPGVTPAYPGAPTAYPGPVAAYPAGIPGYPGGVPAPGAAVPAPAARPVGVTLAAVMAFIQAAWCLMLGGIMVVAASLASTVLAEYFGDVVGAVQGVVGIMVVMGLVGIAMAVLFVIGGIKVLAGAQGWRTGLFVLFGLVLVFPNLLGLLGSINSDVNATGTGPVVLLFVLLSLACVAGIVGLALKASSEWFVGRANARLVGAYPSAATAPMAWPQ